MLSDGCTTCEGTSGVERKSVLVGRGLLRKCLLVTYM